MKRGARGASPAAHNDDDNDDDMCTPLCARITHWITNARPRCTLTLYPNRPVLLQTGLLLIAELAIYRKVSARKRAFKGMRCNSRLCEGSQVTPENGRGVDRDANECLAVRVQFDVPVKRACLLVVWARLRLVEYIDPSAEVPEQVHVHRFEACIRSLCTRCWRFSFHGTQETFGPSRWYASAHNEAMRDRIFPPPQKAARAFIKSLVSHQMLCDEQSREPSRDPIREPNREPNRNPSRDDPSRNAMSSHRIHSSHGECDGAMAQLVVAVTTDAIRDDLFWILHVLQQACLCRCTVGKWIQSRDWYEGAADYATTGARMAKHLLRVLDEDEQEEQEDRAFSLHDILPRM